MPSISRQFALASLVSITAPCFAHAATDSALIVSCDLSREPYIGIAVLQKAVTGKQAMTWVAGKREQLLLGQR